MKHILTFLFIIIFFQINAQDKTISKLKIVKKSITQKISILNDSLIVINKKIDSLYKINQKINLQKRLSNISNNEAITTTKEKVALREKPFTNSKIIKQIEPKTSIIISGFVNNYFKTCIDNDCGFIHFASINENKKTAFIVNSSSDKIENYLDKSLPTKQKTDKTKNYIQIENSTSVYKFPSNYSFQLSDFLKDKIEIISYSNSFFKIKNNLNHTGYITKFSINNYNYFIEKLRKITLQELKEKKQNILITGANVSSINSADGVNINIELLYLNKSKNIKYFEFTFQPYNNVTDIQKSDISGHVNFTGQVTGPIKASDEIKTFTWENAWYNSTITCLKIIKVKVIYMDESSYTYVNELPNILDDNFSNSCK